ncbi:uncharacterized protein METZ01_LOCUS400333, partial [marine metagenome]
MIDLIRIIIGLKKVRDLFLKQFGRPSNRHGPVLYHQQIPHSA